MCGWDGWGGYHSCTPRVGSLSLHSPGGMFPKQTFCSCDPGCCVCLPCHSGQVASQVTSHLGAPPLAAANLIHNGIIADEHCETVKAKLLNTVWLTESAHILSVSCLSLYVLFSSVQFSRSVVLDSLRPHGPQHTRLPCPSQTPGAYSNSCSLSW